MYRVNGPLHTWLSSTNIKPNKASPPSLHTAAAAGRRHRSLLILSVDSLWKPVVRAAERLPASCDCVSPEHSSSLYSDTADSFSLLASSRFDNGGNCSCLHRSDRKWIPTLQADDQVCRSVCVCSCKALIMCVYHLYMPSYDLCWTLSWVQQDCVDELSLSSSQGLFCTFALIETIPTSSDVQPAPAGPQMIHDHTLLMHFSTFPEPSRRREPRSWWPKCAPRFPAVAPSHVPPPAPPAASRPRRTSRDVPEVRQRSVRGRRGGAEPKQQTWRWKRGGGGWRLDPGQLPGWVFYQ